MLDGRRKHLQQIALSPDVFGTTLALILADAFPADHPDETDPFSWDPVTILFELGLFLGEHLDPLAMDKLLAARFILTDQRFFQSLHAFTNVVVALNGHGLPDDEFDPPDAHDLAWGINEAILLTPPRKDDPEPFSAEICAYIRHRLDFEGVHHPEGILQLGGLPEVVSARLRTVLAHDPATLSSAEAGSRERSGGITLFVRERLSSLSQQLRDLPLQTEGAVANARRIAGLIDPATSQRSAS